MSYCRSIKMAFRMVVYAAAATIHIAPAAADVMRGTVYLIEGNSVPGCRSLVVKNEVDSNLRYFRVPDTGSDNSILSLALYAFSTNSRVEVWFSAGDTTGCGTEPKVQLLRMTK